MKLHGYLLTRAEAVLEDVDPVSMTQPEQVRPLDLILKQRLAGIPTPNNGGSYSDHDYPDFEFMDKLEIAEYRDQLAEDMVRMKDEFEEASRALAKKQDEERKKAKPADNEAVTQVTDEDN